MATTRQTLQNILKKTVNIGGCLVWTGCKDKDGYGITSIGNVKMPAHRAAYSFLHDVAGQYVLHKCNVRACVNPDHLYLGDQAQNIQDQIAAGTLKRGSQVGTSKLTEDQIPNIRESKKPYKQLAAEYGVSVSNICSIVKGQSWKHVK